MKSLSGCGLFAIVLLAPLPVRADPISVVSYDVVHALASGAGGWHHAYTGSITPTGAMNFLGPIADYTGGSGTLNDGVVGRTENDTQLFVTNSAPAITLHFDHAHRVSTIALLGGDIFNNSLPGAIEGTVTVTANGMTARLPVKPFGRINGAGTDHFPINDLLAFAGSPLDGLVTNRITLSGFQSSIVSEAVSDRLFSITEIQVNGAADPVPEPATLLLVGSALALGSLRARRRR